ncbi:hypothetical protein [Nostoc sp.]|uniref:hypothetical protein n=1 Tax=Nostoc sp. TaxID=1180 RepID=UPI002FF551ED
MSKFLWIANAKSLIESPLKRTSEIRLYALVVPKRAQGKGWYEDLSRHTYVTQKLGEKVTS